MNKTASPETIFSPDVPKRSVQTATQSPKKIIVAETLTGLTGINHHIEMSGSLE
jgi:hypothetical protein